MADGIKISQLPQLISADVDDTDELVIVDVSEGVSKKITRSKLLGSAFPTVDINGGTIDGTVIGGTTPAAITGTTITGTSFVSSGNMTFGDNDKAIFGAGSDLEIYHSGAQSVIKDVGSGNLYLAGDANVYITDSTLAENKAIFTTNGAASLYYDNAAKLATTSTGISVTGTATASGFTGDLTGDVTGNLTGNVTSTGSSTFSNLDVTTLSIGSTAITATAAELNYVDGVTSNIQTQLDTKLSSISSQSIKDLSDVYSLMAPSDGQILVWDSVNSRWQAEDNTGGGGGGAATLSGVLANGNTTGGYDINVNSGSLITFGDNNKAIFGAGSDLQIYHDAANSFIEESGAGNLIVAGSTEVKIRNTTGGANLAVFKSGAVDLYSSGTKRLETTSTGVDITGTLTSDGLTVDTNTLYVDSTNNRVGVGTSSPNRLLSLYATQPVFQITNVASGNTLGTIQYQVSGDTQFNIDNQGSGSGGVIAFLQAGSERMRIDSSGNLLVGTTSAGVASSSSNAGIQLNSSADYIGVARSGGQPLYLNRLSDDGIILDFRKDGTTVGSIGTYQGDMWIGTGDTTLFFHDSIDAILPAGTSGTGSDGQKTLGYSNSRFKDLYLSGGIEIEEGTGNVGVGKQALNSNTASYNTAVGYLAGRDGTTAANNSLVGFASGLRLTSGSNNVAMGYSSLEFNSTGSNNVALGYQALLLNTTATYNTAVGYQSLYSNTTAQYNTAIGGAAMQYNTTGGENAALGVGALNANTSGSFNTAVGRSALVSNTTASNNTAVGYQAAYSTTTGATNTAVGYETFYSNTSGTQNAAFADRALRANTTGNYNTALGALSLFSNTTASKNTAVGYTAMYANTTGQENAAFAKDALQQNTSGSFNTAVGHQSLASNTTASYNTAVGYRAGYSNTTGTFNNSFGEGALYSTTTANSNDAFGREALYYNTTGSNNAAFGHLALHNNTTAIANTAVGYQAGYANTTSAGNTFIGYYAGNVSTGASNTYVGSGSGYLMTTGARNTILGQFSGNAGGLDIRTSNNNIVLSDGDGNPRGIFDSSGHFLVGKTAHNFATAGFQVEQSSGETVATRSSGTPLVANRLSTDGEIVGLYKASTHIATIGVLFNDNPYFAGVQSGHAGITFEGAEIVPMSAVNRTDNFVDIGNSTYRYDDIYATNGTIQTSDANEKQQIASLTNAEITAAKAISKLFKTFKWNDKVEAKGDAARTHTGVIAQEVQQAMTDAGLDVGNYAFFISTTWWETQTEVPAVEAVDEVVDEDGNVVTEAIEAQEAYTRTDTYKTIEEAPEGATERTRLGIRYPELLSFIGAATEQRLTSIEARLDALENV